MPSQVCDSFFSTGSENSQAMKECANQHHFMISSGRMQTGHRRGWLSRSWSQQGQRGVLDQAQDREAPDRPRQLQEEDRLLAQ